MQLKTPLLAIVLAAIAGAVHAQDRSWQAYLQKVDRNGDGQIDRFEILLVPPRQGGGVKMMLGPRFKAIDRDGNGRLSIAEIDSDRTVRGQSDTSFRDFLTRYPEVAQQDPRAR